MKIPVKILLAFVIITGMLPVLNAKSHPLKTDTPFYEVKSYGATGDGITNDTKAINAAIRDAYEKGGGTVYFAPGNYLSGSIHLLSNISLFLDQGATIIAAPVSAENGYDPAETGATNAYQDYGHSHWHNSLIWGDSLHDISILGTGKIWGKGLYHNFVKGDQTANKAIALVRCRNVIIRDITIEQGGWFAILATGVDNFTLDDVKMDTNRDGVDVDCCKNVRISNCTVNSPHDDGICLKSSFALGFSRPTENVTITNCQVSGFVEGTLLDGTYKHFDASYNGQPVGRIKFGTESNGGFINITISNCVFTYCRGLALESVDGAKLEDVVISNITMRDIVNDPIFIRLGSRMRGPDSIPVGAIHRVMIKNIIVYNAASPYACTISGLPGHDVEDLHLNNIHIYYKGGGSAPETNFNVPEEENKYPEPGMFGLSPAYGFYIRHASDITMNDIALFYQNPDSRPPFVIEDAKGIYLYKITAKKEKDQGNFILRNVSDFHISESRKIPDKQISTSFSGTL